MKAGSTNYDVDTKVKITKSDEADLVGVVGRLTHPFPGLMHGNTKYVAGLRILPVPGQKSVYSGDICNLTKEDKFEVIEE